jgi:hypothetical protein
MHCARMRLNPCNVNDCIGTPKAFWVYVQPPKAQKVGTLGQEGNKTRSC